MPNFKKDEWFQHIREVIREEILEYKKLHGLEELDAYVRKQDLGQLENKILQVIYSYNRHLESKLNVIQQRLDECVECFNTLVEFISEGEGEKRSYRWSSFFKKY